MKPMPPQSSSTRLNPSRSVGRPTRAGAWLACLLAVLGAAGAGAQTTEIRVGVGPVDAAAAIFYADKTGLYKKAGLDVRLTKLPTGASILSGIAGGSLDVGQGSALALIQGFVRGLPFTAIGGIQTYDSAKPDYGLLVPVDSPIAKATDLGGKTFGVVGLQDQNSLATFAWLDAHGVDRTTLKFVEMPASAMLAAMDSHRIDAATFYEPFYSSLLATGKVRVLADPYSAIGKRYADAMLYGNKTWVDGHRELVGKFLVVTRDANAFVGAHESEVVPITAEYTGADPTTLSSMHHGTRSMALTPDAVQPMIDVAAKYKMIDKAFPAADMICSCALRR
jgi:NitT/TauT family transport system substrate-binding protein